jgi:hypothetical protein
MAGTSGLASIFSWLEPFRSFLVSLTVGVLGFAWFQKLKVNESVDYSCGKGKTSSFMQSKVLLVGITLFAVLILTFPYYAGIFFSKTDLKVTSAAATTKTVAFSISGMTRSSCEEHVNQEVSKLDGIVTLPSRMIMEIPLLSLMIH